MPTNLNISNILNDKQISPMQKWNAVIDIIYNNTIPFDSRLNVFENALKNVDTPHKSAMLFFLTLFTNDVIKQEFKAESFKKFVENNIDILNSISDSHFDPLYRKNSINSIDNAKNLEYTLINKNQFAILLECSLKNLSDENKLKTLDEKLEVATSRAVSINKHLEKVASPVVEKKYIKSKANNIEVIKVILASKLVILLDNWSHDGLEEIFNIARKFNIDLHDVKATKSGFVSPMKIAVSINDIELVKTLKNNGYDDPAADKLISANTSIEIKNLFNLVKISNVNNNAPNPAKELVLNKEKAADPLKELLKTIAVEACEKIHGITGEQANLESSADQE